MRQKEEDECELVDEMVTYGGLPGGVTAPPNALVLAVLAAGALGAK